MVSRPTNLIISLAVILLFSLHLAAKQEHNLIEVNTVIPDIVLDIRYATENNFTAQQIYTSPKCYLLKDVTEALCKVQNSLRPLGLGIKIWDGYRPLSAQWVLWNIVPDERYVADPRKGGRHCRGTAVDVTLVTLATGEELPMPTEFDDLTEKAWRSNNDLPQEVIQNRQLLQDVMEQHGFKGLPTEWWHFDFQGWENKTSLDVDFEALHVE